MNVQGGKCIKLDMIISLRDQASYGTAKKFVKENERSKSETEEKKPDSRRKQTFFFTCVTQFTDRGTTQKKMIEEARVQKKASI